LKRKLSENAILTEITKPRNGGVWSSRQSKLAFLAGSHINNKTKNLVPTKSANKPGIFGASQLLIDSECEVRIYNYFNIILNVFFNVISAEF